MTPDRSDSVCLTRRGSLVFHGTAPRDFVRIAVATSAGLAAGMTLLLLLNVRRTHPAPEAEKFAQLALRNEHYAG